MNLLRSRARTCRVALLVAMGLGLLVEGSPVSAVHITPFADEEASEFDSYPELVQDVGMETPEQSPQPVIPSELVLELATTSVGKHLLITGRAVRNDDEEVPVELGDVKGDLLTPTDPASLFQWLMATLLLGVPVVTYLFPRWIAMFTKGKRRSRRSHRRHRRTKTYGHRSHSRPRRQSRHHRRRVAARR